MENANGALAALLAATLLLGRSAGAAEPADAPLKVGGAIRFNYVHKSWQGEYRHGFVGLDTARLDLNYDDGKLIGSAQYRYNRFPKGQGGYWQHFLHHGWIGMRFSDQGELHAGLDRNPFGLLPLASNNFYESIAFYAGLEDKYDLGVAYLSPPGPFEWQLAFYPRDGGSYGGGANTAGKSNRYSYNIVPDDDKQGFGTGQRDSERDTLVGRVAWHVGPDRRYEFGLSGLTGAIDNGGGARTRRHAIAVHAQGTYGPVKVMLESLRYRYGTAHAPARTYDGLDANSFVMVGAFGYPFPLASKGDIHVVNVSYDITGRLGPFSGFKAYNDYSVLRKRSGPFMDSVQNITGLTFSSGKWTFYFDLMLGKHHPYLSPDFGGLAATSAAHDGWTRRINLQAGYYF